jgi:uncharacterized protein
VRVSHLPAYEFRRQRWANERGWTREIIRQPAEGRFDWRVSIAEIDRDGGFSRFPGMRRVLVLLQGAGLRLRLDGGAPHHLQPPFGRLAFDGAAEVDSELVDGPVHAFNLIHDPARYDAEVLVRPLVGPMVFFDQAATDWLIHLVGGTARLQVGDDSVALGTGDAVHLHGDGSDRRAILDGGGELLLVRLSRQPG